MDEHIYCTNCKRPTTGHLAFEGVLICHDCLDFVNHKVMRAKTRLMDLLALYKDHVRARLVEGKLFLPVKEEAYPIPSLDQLNKLVETPE